MNTSGRPVLFFDGVCNLCNRSVQFVIRNDKKQQFLFAPLQGVAGGIILKQLHEHTGHQPDSVILYYKNKYYTQSDAVLQVLRLLGGKWLPFTALHIIPGFIRNGLYSAVARSRYKWFGKTDSCMVPTPTLQERFLK